jgi:tyrosine-protein kinase Etk/Wzc
MKKMETASFIDYLEVIIKWRKFIVRNVIVITIIAVIVSLLLTKKYTATATMLPPSSEQNMMLSFMAGGGLPGGLSNIPGISSILPGLATPSDLYAAILRSGRIKSKIVKKFDLKRVFKAKKMYNVYEILDEITQITVSPEGIVSVSVTYKDKHLASDIANTYLAELDRFNTETAMTTGKRYRIFIEERLKDTSDSLARTEEALRQFQEKHHMIAIDIEIEKAIATIAELKSRIILLEVKKGALTSSSQIDNPYLYNINKELRELKKQLSKIEFGEKQKNKKEFGAGFSVPFSELPEVSLEYVRVLRNVKVQEAIYELLTQQYEQAKITELKDTPTIQILDRASPPEKKSFPKRAIIVILSFFGAIAANILVIFGIEYIRDERKDDKSSVSRVINILNILKTDFLTFIKRFKR